MKKFTIILTGIASLMLIAAIPVLCLLSGKSKPKEEYDLPYTVNQAQWESALSSPDNYTAIIGKDGVEYVQGFVDGNKRSLETGVIFVVGEQYIKYEKTPDYWRVSEATEAEYKSLCSFAFVLGELSGDKALFTYSAETKEYAAPSIDKREALSVVLNDVTIKFNEGRLAYFSFNCEYGGSVYSYLIDGTDDTAIDLPQNIIYG